MQLEPLPVNITPELVFGLIAPIGVDLDLVSEVLGVTLHEMHYNSHEFRLTQLMRAVTVPAQQSRCDPSRPDQSLVRSYQERIAYANAIRRSLGDPALAALAVSAIRSFRVEEWQRRITAREQGLAEVPPNPEEEPIPSQAYIIRQLKRPEEVTLLREVYGRQFVLISAYASQDWRARRLERLERESIGGLVSEIEAQSRARALVLQDAKESQDTHGQNVRDAFPLGDVFIDATSRINCERELRRFIHLLFGSMRLPQRTMSMDHTWPSLLPSDLLTSPGKLGRQSFARQERCSRSGATKSQEPAVEPTGREISQTPEISSGDQILMNQERHKF